MKILHSFIYFVKKPEQTLPVSLTITQSLIFLLKCIPIYFLFIFICSLFFIPIVVFYQMPELPTPKSSDIIWLILFGPIIEELIFRLSLFNFFKNIFVALALGSYALLKSRIGIPLSISVALIVILLPYIPGFINNNQKLIDNFFEKNFKWFFYLSSLIFGFLHITNLVEITTTYLLLSPIIVLYQIILGLFLGFIRVKYRFGIIYAIAVHSIYNSIPLMIKLL